MEKITRIIFSLCMFAVVLAGCRSAQSSRDESLDEARVKHAVDAERIKWVTELSESIADRLREADSRIETITNSQRATLEAAREYRSLVLIIIERLQRAENREPEAD